MSNNKGNVYSINKGGDVMYTIQMRIGGLYLQRVENAGDKPYGGLWTASLLDDRLGSSWTEWCEKEEYNLPKDGIWRAYLLQPNKDARIYTIDSIDDYYTLLNKYKSYSIDYEAASKDYDAIHLTWDGIYDTHNELYGWDVESTVWLNEAYTVIEEVTFEVTKKEFDDECMEDIFDYKVRRYSLSKYNSGVYRWKYTHRMAMHRDTNTLYKRHNYIRMYKVMRLIMSFNTGLSAVEALDFWFSTKHNWTRDEVLSMKLIAKIEEL